jgi:glyoxylate reductase
MKPKVYSTRPLHQAMLDILKSKTEARMPTEEGVPTKELLLKEMTNVEAVICAFGDPIDADVMKATKNLKVIHVLTQALNPNDYRYFGIDFDEATKRGICITNAPVMAEPIADFTFALMLAVARRIIESDKFVREGKWPTTFKGKSQHDEARWSYALHIGTDVYNKTLGILGLGRIGRMVARRAKSFNMKILYHDTIRQTAIEDVLGIEFREKDELLRQSDFVTIHVPAVKHAIGKRELALMKKTAYIINTSRGSNIDLKALIEALEKGQIAGAGLDVYEGEPIGLDSPLLKMSNVVLSHHQAPFSVETSKSMGEGALENILSAIEGRVPPNLVNQDAVKRK